MPYLKTSFYDNNSTSLFFIEVTSYSRNGRRGVKRLCHSYVILMPYLLWDCRDVKLLGKNVELERGLLVGGGSFSPSPLFVG